MIAIGIPTLNAGTLDLNANVVLPDVPLFIGIDILDEGQFVTNNVENQI